MAAVSGLSDIHRRRPRGIRCHADRILRPRGLSRSRTSPRTPSGNEQAMGCSPPRLLDQTHSAATTVSAMAMDAILKPPCPLPRAHRPLDQRPPPCGPARHRRKGPGSRQPDAEELVSKPVDAAVADTSVGFSIARPGISFPGTTTSTCSLAAVFGPDALIMVDWSLVLPWGLPQAAPTTGRSDRTPIQFCRNARFRCGCSTPRRPATTPMAVHNGVDLKRALVMVALSQCHRPAISITFAHPRSEPDQMEPGSLMDNTHCRICGSDLPSTMQDRQRPHTCNARAGARTGMTSADWKAVACWLDPGRNHPRGQMGSE